MSLLASLTLAQALSYAIVLWLFAVAIGHLFEAIAWTRRMRLSADDLEALVNDMPHGLAAGRAREKAEAIVRGSLLDGLFRMSKRLLLPGGVADQVEEILGRAVGELVEAVQVNESAGPRFGLVLTAFAIFTRFAGGGTEVRFESVGVAVITTGAGMSIAILEAFTDQRVLSPMIRRLNEAANQILVAAAFPTTQEPESDVSRANPASYASLHAALMIEGELGGGHAG